MDIGMKYGGLIAIVMLLSREVVKITPNKHDDRWVGFVFKIIRGIFKTFGLELPNIDKLK